MPWRYTPNYDFKIAGENDNDLFFINWRTGVDGTDKDSNFMKIDSILKAQEERIDNLSNIQHMYYVSATKNETDDSYIAENPQIEAYNNNIMIMLSLNVTNTGQVSLNINDLGLLYVKKYDTNGNLIDLVANDFRANRIYILIYSKEQNVWIVVSDLSSDDIKLDFPLNQFRGVVTDLTTIENPKLNDIALIYDPSTLNNDYIGLHGLYEDTTLPKPSLTPFVKTNLYMYSKLYSSTTDEFGWVSVISQRHECINLNHEYNLINTIGWIWNLPESTTPPEGIVIANIEAGTYVQSIQFKIKKRYNANAKLFIGSDNWDGGLNKTLLVGPSEISSLTVEGEYFILTPFWFRLPCEIKIWIESVVGETGELGDIKICTC